MARDPLTLDAVVCASCGTRFKRDRDRCPRCRARPAVVDPAAVAASSRRLARIGASVMVVGVMGVAGVWLLAPEAKTPVPTGPVVDPLAARRAAAHTPDVAPAPAPAPAERPFMDPVGAVYESDQAGDFGSALKHYQAAAARNPQDPEALSNLGQVLVRLGRVAEALPYFSKALELNPDRWTYQFNRARAEGLLEHWTECIAGYRRAQQLFPNDYATAYNLALALHRSGDDEGAVGEFEKAIALAPGDGTFHRALGISLERLNRKSEAAAAYADYLKLSPDASDAEKVRERIVVLTSAAGSPAAPVKPTEPRD